jgi:hypothetical protein
MRSTTFTVRVNAVAKKRLERWPRAPAAAVLCSRPRRSTRISTSTSGRSPASNERSRLSIAAKRSPTTRSKSGSRLGAAVGSGRRGERIGAAAICELLGAYGEPNTVNHLIDHLINVTSLP